jgi:hypothetical protein
MKHITICQQYSITKFWGGKFETHVNEKNNFTRVIKKYTEREQRNVMICASEQE